MDYRTLDLTIVSAEDLKNVSHFSKMRPFAVAWVDPYHRQSTHVDKHGGSNPSWDKRLSFALPEHFFRQPGSRLYIEIYSKGSLLGNRFVGAAVISLPELFQQSNSKQVMTYQLRRRSGKAKGAVRLSVQIGEKGTMPGQSGYTGTSSDPVTAYPYHNQNPHNPQFQSGGYGYPPQPQYPPYPPQGYYPQYPQQQSVPPRRRPGMMGGMGGMGTGLLAGALGGLLVGDIIDDVGDHNGGYDGGGYDGGYDGGGYDGGGFDGGGFDGGF